MNTEKGIQIYIRRGEQSLGPFSWEEIRSKLAKGEFEPKEPAWHEGLASWSTPGAVLNAEADRLVRKHSQDGIYSAVIAGVNMLTALILPIFFILIEHMEDNELSDALSLIMVFAFFGLGGLSLTGLVLGIIGGFDRENKKKELALTGLVVNGLILLSFAGIIGFIVYQNTKDYGSL